MAGMRATVREVFGAEISRKGAEPVRVCGGVEQRAESAASGGVRGEGHHAGARGRSAAATGGESGFCALRGRALEGKDG